MTSCCPCFNNGPKVPDPYCFDFRGSDITQANVRNFELNSVKTSKYNVITFVPLALLQQFKRMANIYFLIIAVLQSIPIISPLGPFTAWAPLIFVICISMIRQGIEDYRRYKSDKKLNLESKTKIRRDSKFIEVPWSQVIIGDVVMVEEGEMFPADLILLASSIQGGNAYIETASLDGEKNLKPRVAPRQTSPYRDELLLNELSGQCICAQPNKDLHDFQASMLLAGQNKKLIIEGDKQLLYRQAKLKNTKWIYGLVVYTGRVTKIMLNSQMQADKMSQVQVKVNRLLVFIFLFQVILCLVCSVAFGLTQPEISSHWYIEHETSTTLASVMVFLSYLVLFNTMIPISLIVSLEIVKTVQAVFIQQDKLLFNERRQKGVSVFSSALNEELGQIQYVFTDKTGTLTCNIMEFKIAVIGDHMFGDRSIIADQFDMSTVGDTSVTPLTASNKKGYYDEELYRLTKGQMPDKKLLTPLTIKLANGQTAMTITSQKQLADEYLLALSTAHECVVEEDKHKNVFYQGPSPDQITLVDAAKNMDYIYRRSDNQYIYVQVNGKEQRFELLGVHPFTSDRKRMSVIIKHNGMIKMFVKGADSIIKKRISKEAQPFMDSLDRYLNIFAIKGLRTLLVGMKVITQAEYDNFKLQESQLPEEGRAKKRQELIAKLQEGFFLIGATAVLDRLQDNVPQTIRDLLRANIKVWMLTGDKMETAENIAMSCNLIQPDFKVLKYQPKSGDFLRELQDVADQAEGYRRAGIKKAFLVEGQHLAKLLVTEDTRVLLADMAVYCQGVVCCRLLPAQKAEVVDLVRKYLNKITLSIGDGANDVPMIKTAHIGVGLYGQEGMGAVQASDYALPEFQGLWRLLFVHGRWNYIRIAEMILYFFYKNMVFTIPQFFYAFYCGFSGQSLFDDTYISLYNIVFTAVPLVCRAILEQDIYYIYKKDGQQVRRSMNDLPEGYHERQTLKSLYPKIYYVGQQNTIFNYGKFALWLLEAILEALLITMITIYVVGEASINGSGQTSDLWLCSITTFSAIIMVVSFKIATHTRFWSWIMFACLLLLSVCLYIGYMWVSNGISGMYGTILMAHTTADTYLVVFFCVGILLIIDGLLVFLDFWKGGYASKMRQVVEHDRISSGTYYDQLSLRLTELGNKK